MWAHRDADGRHGPGTAAPLGKVLKSTAQKARAPRTVLDDGVIKAVLGFVKKNPGLGVAKIVEGTAMNKGTVVKVLAKARALRPEAESGGLAAVLSMAILSPLETVYCLPPVAMTANSIGKYYTGKA